MNMLAEIDLSPGGPNIGIVNVPARYFKNWWYCLAVGKGILRKNKIKAYGKVFEIYDEPKTYLVMIIGYFIYSGLWIYFNNIIFKNFDLWIYYNNYKIGKLDCLKIFYIIFYMEKIDIRLYFFADGNPLEIILKKKDYLKIWSLNKIMNFEILKYNLFIFFFNIYLFILIFMEKKYLFLEKKNIWI